MLYSNLLDYYRTLNHMQDYKYQMSDVENMIPFEREIHIDLIMKQLSGQGNTTSNSVEAPID